MAEYDQEQKTEQPTGKHLQDATERGEFAKAPELQVLASLVTALGILAFIERSAIDRVSEYAVGDFLGLCDNVHAAGNKTKTYRLGGTQKLP